MNLLSFKQNYSTLVRIMLLCLATILINSIGNNTVYASLAGIVNPEDGKIFTLKEHASYFNNGLYNFNGGSTTGQISWIKLYINDNLQGYVKNANEGSWYLDKKFDPGVNNIYIYIKSINGTYEKSPTRSVIFIPTPDLGDFRVSKEEYQDKIEIKSYLTLKGDISTYYKVWRCDENKTNGIGWQIVNEWQTDDVIIDQNVVAGKEYYYFLQISSKSNGQFPSDYSPGQIGYTETPYTYYYDGDGDGYGDPDEFTTAFTPPDKYVTNNLDNCPTDPNKKDNGYCGCDVSDDLYIFYYDDNDNDTFGDPNISEQSCTQPPGFVSNKLDLCPTDPNKKEEGHCGCNNSEDNYVTYYLDIDNDTFGDPDSPKQMCSQDEGYVKNKLDNCPSDPNKIEPGNCGCMEDENNYLTYFSDEDNDTFGNPKKFTQSCSQPDNFVINDQDQCPSDSNKKEPGFCGCNNADSNYVKYYADEDNDTYGNHDNYTQSCTQPAGFVSNDQDQCPFNSNKKLPGNCGCDVPETNFITYYEDADNDLFGDPSTPIDACTEQDGYVANSLDQCPLDSDIVSMNISAKQTFGSPGSAVSIPVYLSDVCSNGLNMDSFGFIVLFDGDILNFVDVDKSNTLIENFTLIRGEVLEKGKAKIGGALFDQPLLINNDGVFVKLNFSVNQNATKDSTIELTDLKNDIQNMQTSPSQFILKYKVTINTAGNGNGSVNKEIVYLKPEETIDLKAIPAENSDFVGWSGDISSLNQTITLENISSDKLITANFDIKTFNITIKSLGDGTVSKQSQIVQYGDNLEIEASPAISSNFIGWYGDVSATEKKIVLENITSDKSITANFELKTFNINIYTQGEGSVSQESTVVHYGDNLEINASPAISSNFIGWSGDISTTDKKIVIENITSNKSITANFKLKSLSITINTQGEGAVSQESTIVNYGDKLEITASPAISSNFIGWSGDISTTEKKIALENITSDKSITANFELKTFNVTIYTQGEGSVSQESTIVNYGDNLEINASPAISSNFIGWSGDISATEKKIALENITSDKSITANFELKTFNVKIYTQGEGSVSQESTVVHYGDNLEITASPAISSNFIGWHGDISATEKKIVLENITSDQSITANFELKTFTITINTQGDGTVSQESTIVHYGDNLEITASPAISSNFIGWHGDISATEKKIVLENITSNQTITANFESKTFNISINTKGEGTVTQESTVVNYGDNLQLTASPARGSVFSGWSGAISNTENTIALLSITSDTSITANFDLKTFTVTINKTGEGTVSKETQEVQYGEDLEITATPENGFMFIGWSGDYSYTNSTIILKNIIADQSITANFGQNTFTKLTIPSEIKIIPGSKINIPVYLEYNPSDNEIRGIDITLLENNGFLKLLDVDLSDGILSSYEKNVNLELKDIAVYISNSEKISGSGKLMDVIFRVNNNISEPISTSTLEFAEAFFNEDEIPHNQCKLMVSQIFQTDIAFVIEEDQVLTGNFSDYISDSVNQSLSFNIVEQSSKGTAQLTNQSGGFLYTPFINQFGQDSFVISVTDGNFDPITTTVLLSISPLDDPPTITNLTDQKGNMNIPLTVLFAINDLDTPVENLHLSVSSSNENLIESIKLSGTDNNRSIVIQPAFGQIGNTTITIELSDETNTIQKGFNLSIRDIEIGFLNETCMICAPGETVSISLNLINSAIPTIDNIQLSVAYDPGLLSPLGISFTGAFFDSDPYTHTYDFQLDEGLLNVNIQLNSSVNKGVVGNLLFSVNGKAILGESTSVVINNAMINNQPITANAGCIELTGFTINGVVYHFNGKPVPDTRVDLLGRKSYHTFTDESGAYTLVGLPEDFYTISYSKIDNSTIGLAAYDVSLIGQYITQLVELGCYEKIASDVSQNGDILSYDAGSLALYVAELQTDMNNTNTHWTFVTQPINRCDWTHDNLIDYQSTETIYLTENMHYSVTAVKLGDVTGNWTPSIEEEIQKRCAKRKSYGKIEVLRNAHFNVPVILTEYTNVAGLNLKIKYDAEILNFSDASLDDSVLGSGEYRMMINQTVPGQLIILLYSNLGSSIVSGNVVNLSFDSIKSGSGMINIEELICDEVGAIGGFEPKGLDKSYPVQKLMVTVEKQIIQNR
ncbi:transmembrane protein [Candidatus Magnetomorum sp. HK-1]|nr:transmembrane protein [Candidatus Magnetomorum sp. HK-1]